MGTLRLPVEERLKQKLEKFVDDGDREICLLISQIATLIEGQRKP